MGTATASTVAVTAVVAAAVGAAGSVAAAVSVLGVPGDAAGLHAANAKIKSANRAAQLSVCTLSAARIRNRIRIDPSFCSAFVAVC